MTRRADEGRAGWFVDIDPSDPRAAAERIRDGAASAPADWPAIAVETNVVANADEYYSLLQEAAVAAARAMVRDRERADDQQLIHTVRAMDDCRRTANELAERLAEWAGSYFGESHSGIEYARELVGREPGDPMEARIVSLAERIVALADEADALRASIERDAPAVAPNLAALAGPVLAARLIGLAGGLEALAKQPAGTVQVLGAEDALFAHLAGRGSSPKHGVIYTHEYVRETNPEDRGSAARAVAGKLAIAARIDHYAGDRRPDLERELAERMARIQSRGET